ncbi:spore germination protein [Aquibacillus albus]|uniref:Spore germination protein KA n=1 Tax=Aquibacillus albus TaxID=1168171 RepID=A0ABS2N302_9BACI|nr:spore germination protein KA [Aquibacillus albus]
MFPLFKKSENKENKQQTNVDKVSIYKDIKKNEQYTKQLFSSDINKDFTFRTVTAKYCDKQVDMFFYSSIVNNEKIYKGIVRPLLEADGKTITDVITIESLTEIKDFDTVVNQINSGKAVIFIDDEDTAYSVNVADFQARTVQKPENERVVRGPKEAFTEGLGTNVSLIRKRFHNRNLIAETALVGERSQLEVSLMYVNDLVDKDILKNVKDRLENLSVDNISNVELLEQYLEERPYSLFPTILYTERPDYAAQFIEDGYIVLLMDNSSAALILPATFWSFFHSPEDRYSRFLFGNFTRILRMTAFAITILSSATYIAITNFHSEMIPPDLLLAITNSRERIPLPLFIEVIIMEIAFELIREAGIRVPNPLGPTIGIVGALILGQAAVEAGIISPIIVIVAALSGLTSFAISNTSLNTAVRISRFLFIFSASFFGMFSLVGALFLWVIYMASIKSFGVPYFSPLSPSFKSSGDMYFRNIIKHEMWRPGQIKPNNLQKKNIPNKGDSKP